jgi:hypothetical protein
MVQEGDVIVIHFLERQPVGKRFLRHRNDWPLHVTLLPWFFVPDEAALQAELSKLASATPLISTIFAEQAKFNPTTNVTLVRDATLLHKLHIDLLNSAGKVDAQHRTLEWTGDNYQPHATHHDGQPVPQTGDELVVDNFSLVRMLDGNMCEVVRHFELKDPREAAA